MTAKQYLQRYEYFERKYIAAIEEIKTLEQEMISLKSPNFDERVQTSIVSDPICEMFCKLESEKGKLVMKITKYKGQMALIKNQIAELEDDCNNYYAILLFRYIFHKDWKFIGDNLRYSRTQLNRLHGMALKEFDARFKEIYGDK